VTKYFKLEKCCNAAPESHTLHSDHDPAGQAENVRPVYASRGRLKPLCAADARSNSLGHHPGGEYYLRYAGKWEAVGNDPCVALDRFEQRKFELRQSATTDGAGSTGQLSRLTKPHRFGKFGSAVDCDAVESLAPPVVSRNLEAGDRTRLVHQLRGFLLERHAVDQISRALLR